MVEARLGVLPGDLQMASRVGAARELGPDLIGNVRGLGYMINRPVE